MDIIRFSIANPVKVTVGVILTVLFGIIALTTIPIQLTPNVDEPVITIETNWTGRSPEEVEREIIEEQEEYLKSLGGLKKMTAEAQTGQRVDHPRVFHRHGRERRPHPRVRQTPRGAGLPRRCR